MACDTSRPEGWLRDPNQFQEEYDAHGTFQAMSLAHGGAQSTYQNWAKRHGITPHTKAGPKVGGAVDDESVTLDADRLSDIHQQLRDRGLDPDDWIVIRVVVNTWDGFYTTGPKEEKTADSRELRQLKVTLRPRLDAIFRQAHDVAPVKRAKPKQPKNGARLIVFVGDEQAPYHDEHLNELFLQWLEWNKPDNGVHLGDLMDLPTLSRHRPNPLWNADPQECIQAGYEILQARVEASPETEWEALPGNHDERIRDYQLQRAPAMYGIRPADLDDRELAAVHALPTLLHLDKLGVKWHGSDGDYEHAQVDIGPELVARHGWVTGANSAAKTVDRLGLSVVVGHTHRQVITYVTQERRRETFVLMCIEAGCMCRVEGGLGYVINPNWQAGWAVANVWPDGSFHIDHATYREGVLRWRDQRYE